HRRAGIEQHEEARVGLALISANVRALGARKHVPVDEARVVALDVGAELRKFLAEAEARRAMQADEEAFHGRARDELEVREPREHIGRQQACGSGFAHSRPPRSWPSTRSVSTLSTVTPSDSA